MKTFNKTSLVERINYNGLTYTPNAHISATFAANRRSLPNILKDLNKGGRKAILVQVLSRNLRGKTDIHGNLYQPTSWIYTT